MLSDLILTPHDPIFALKWAGFFTKRGNPNLNGLTLTHNLNPYTNPDTNPIPEVNPNPN